MPRDVVLLSDQPRTIRSVRDALANNGQWTDANTGGPVSDLSARLDSAPAQAVVVYLTDQPERMLREMERVITQHPRSRFIAVGESDDHNLLVEAMQAGFRRLVPRGQIGDSLAEVLSRVCAQADADQAAAGGRVISVLSAGGGCGATTIAVNLACELALASGDKALLIDLDAHYGGIADYIGAQGQYGIADVLRDAHRIDSELIRSTAQHAGAQLDILLSPATTSPLDTAPFVPANLALLTPALRSAYRNSVIGAPRVSADTAAELATHSDACFLVIQASVKSLRIAKTMMASLASRGVPVSQVTPVVNRFSHRGQMITMEQVTQALRTERVKRVSNDYRSAARCMDFGQPLASGARRSVLRQDVADLAGWLDGKAPSKRRWRLFR